LKRFLVTGGAGFIGSHIVDRLVRDGQYVRILDDFSTGRKENIARDLDRIDVVRGSVADLPRVREAVEGIDYVLHHAALPSVVRSIDDPIGFNTANIDGTLNVLVAARDAGVKRLVYASSASVYGDTPFLPVPEDVPLSPLSPYALTKLAGEHYCTVFHHIYGFEAVALRYFNVFGPRQDPDSQYAAAVPRFARAILAGDPPTIYGDGQQTRDFTYVENCVEANLLACGTPGIGGQVFNIASGQRYSLLDLVQALNDILGRAVEPVFEEARPGDIKHSQADIGRAECAMGFEPSVNFAEGLRRLVEWMRETG